MPESSSVRSLFASLLLCSMSAASTACTRSAAATPAPAITVEDAKDADVVTVAGADRFAVATAAERDVHATVQAPGVVAADVSRPVPVLSLASGRVVDVRARLGDTVAKGQVLITLQSADVSQARADVNKAAADAELARRALERAQALSEHEALAAKDLEAAVNADTKARTDLRTARERLQLLTGGSDEAASPLVALKAPVSGVIVEQNVSASGGVRSLDNSPNLFTIADLSRVWIVCDVNENNLADVRIGDAAAAVLNAYPDRPVHARVANISGILDPATRTAKVRLEVANPDRLLRPGMFARVTFTSQETRKVTVIPTTAVLRLHDRDWVFAPLGGGRFRRVEIRTAHDQDGVQQVASGLRPGDRVVVDALQLSSAADAQ
jgi:cobalt-zinc-cadmium efflux system membrane fusion protein